ncbi:MAG: hypothetical protein AB1646_17280 [Thermodesulfobacteriota bacterium]
MKKKLILAKDRQAKHISIRIPEDVLADLRRVAPLKGMSGYQALIKFYIGQGLRKDLRELWEERQGGRLETVLADCGVDLDQRREILDRLKEEPAAQP